MVEIEESQRLLAGQDLAALAVERDQRRRRIEHAAEQVADPGPASMDAAVERGRRQHRTVGEPVCRLEHDSLVGPVRCEHRPEPRLGQLEPIELSLEPDPRQRSKQRKHRRKHGGRKEHHPVIARREPDLDLDRAARQSGRGHARGLERQLELESRAEVRTGEVAEVDALGGGSTGCDEGVA